VLLGYKTVLWLLTKMVALPCRSCCGPRGQRQCHALSLSVLGVPAGPWSCEEWKAGQSETHGRRAVFLIGHFVKLPKPRASLRPVAPLPLLGSLWSLGRSTGRSSMQTREKSALSLLLVYFSG
jgi:hypothetical protein